ncbi:MAG: hypothetical protein QNJ71_02125 [Acidimicrobiia bacterium]|nr:hypothetical protein [Acidimicrobiia bacterium]
MSSSLARRLRSEESGLSTLEWIGIVAFVLAILAMIPPIREAAIEATGVVFNQRDPDTGELSDFSVAMRGFGIALGSIIVFVGTGFFLLYTNVGRRLAFLLTGAAVFGWLVINGILFVVYAPRGIRPENLEGLNAFQIRLPAVALTLGSLVLFAMFIVALNRYEADTAE